MTLWKNGIETKACGGVRTKEEETPYIYVNVSLKNSDILGRLNNITQKGENYLDLCFDAGDDSLDIVIKGENVYQDVVEEFQKEPPKKNILDFLAEEQLLTSTVLAKHIENNQQLKYTEKDVEEIVLDTAKEHKEQADRNEALLREKYENEIRTCSTCACFVVAGAGLQSCQTRQLWCHFRQWGKQCHGATRHPLHQ